MSLSRTKTVAYFGLFVLIELLLARVLHVVPLWAIRAAFASFVFITIPLPEPQTKPQLPRETSSSPSRNGETLTEVKSSLDATPRAPVTNVSSSPAEAISTTSASPPENDDSLNATSRLDLDPSSNASSLSLSSSGAATKKKSKLSRLFTTSSSQREKPQTTATSPVVATETITANPPSVPTVSEGDNLQGGSRSTEKKLVLEYDPHTQLDKFGYGRPAPPPPPGYVYKEPRPESHLGHLTPEQEAVLAELRAFAGKLHVEEASRNLGLFRLDDACLLRFLRARKFNVKKTEHMLQRAVEWRNTVMPPLITAANVGAETLALGFCRFGPKTREWLPVTMVKVEHFNPADFKDIETFTRCCAYFFERITYTLPPGAERGLLFFDMKGWSLWRHASPWGMKLIGKLIEIIQDINPERLEKAVLFNAPAIFSGTWKIIKGLLDPVVAAKVFFVYDTSKVLELVEEAQLPKEYGGARVQPYPIEGLSELLLEKEIGRSS